MPTWGCGRTISRVTALDTPPDVVLLDVGGTADTSVTVMDAFAETDRRLATGRTTLWVAAVPTRALEKAERTAAWEAWSAAGRLHPTVGAAIASYERDDRSC